MTPFQVRCRAAPLVNCLPVYPESSSNVHDAHSLGQEHQSPHATPRARVTGVMKRALKLSVLRVEAAAPFA